MPEEYQEKLDNAEFAHAIDIITKFVNEKHPEQPRHVDWAIKVLEYHRKALIHCTHKT
jgi:hypothetical protein